ncbi:hypothetical protein R2F61_06785 [Mollicutes bacterium LVI A0078]|nr:hypothetical protein RZE84_06790 [Mollicutes bacterium LVI A0075]WOO90434.1 hypothetical protein R2F61_06785 [Mollicutes bacterium LVI A0078]
MIHKISFSNIYSYNHPVEIKFNSTSNIYSIHGHACSGKTNLLHIIEIITHIFWDVPSYDNLHKIVNRDSNSNIITMAIDFTFDNVCYCFEGEIDLTQNCFSKQSFKAINSKRYIFKWDNNDDLYSDFFSEAQIATLRTFEYKKNGVFPYVDSLDDGNRIEELKALKDAGSKQDYLDLKSLFSTSTSIERITEMMQIIDPSLKTISIFDCELDYQKVQGSPTELSNPKINHSLDLNVSFSYDNYKCTFNQQSHGFRKCFKLCIELLASTKQLYFQPRLIDNLSSYIDDQLLKQILELYGHEYKRQLIFTSYKSTILESKLLPKESIIIVNKDEICSTIYKLSDYKGLRSSDRHNWKRMYEQGKFK